MIEQQGIDLYMGKGVIKDAHTVSVDDTELESRKYCYRYWPTQPSTRN